MTSSSPLLLTQLSDRLHLIFGDLIAVPENEASTEEARRQRFLSRAYMALSLHHNTGATISEAADAITDGSKDDGIDCIYVNEKSKRIYLGQSKFSSNTNKGFKLDEFNRLRDGVRRVLMLRWDSEN